MSHAVETDQHETRLQSFGRFVWRWRRRMLVPVGVLLLIGVVLFVRNHRLSEVPDIGIPFSTAGVFDPIPLEDNAEPLFRDAYAAYVDVDSADRDEYSRQAEDGWDPYDHLIEKQLRLNQAALELFRAAADKPDYQPQSLAALNSHEFDEQKNQRFDLIRLAVRSIERSVRTNRPQHALPDLRAVFRASGLVTRHTDGGTRHFGMWHHRRGLLVVQEWLEHPRTSSTDIAGIEAIVREAEELRAKLSDSLKIGHLAMREDFPTGSIKELEQWHKRWGVDFDFNKWDLWWRAEPKYTWRWEAHITANQLQFVDMPRRKRPRMLDRGVYDDSSLSSLHPGQLPGRRLTRIHPSFSFRGHSELLIEMETDHRVEHRCLLVVLAAHRYFRDHGDFPNSLSELQPKYLTDLPDDPYSPKPAPLLYRRNGVDAVVYSRYENGVDNGGAIVIFDENQETSTPETKDRGVRFRAPRYPPAKAEKPAAAHGGVGSSPRIVFVVPDHASQFSKRRKP